MKNLTLEVTILIQNTSPLLRIKLNGNFSKTCNDTQQNRMSNRTGKRATSPPPSSAAAVTAPAAALVPPSPVKPRKLRNDAVDKFKKSPARMEYAQRLASKDETGVRVMQAEVFLGDIKLQFGQHAMVRCSLVTTIDMGERSHRKTSQQRSGIPNCNTVRPTEAMVRNGITQYMFYSTDSYRPEDNSYLVVIVDFGLDGGGSVQAGGGEAESANDVPDMGDSDGEAGFASFFFGEQV